MATGGVFKLVANDGKAYRMLLATALLRQRILDIFNSRKHAGKADLTPTLVDIERTHILYVNAHFKPFAAIGFEYSKIMAQSGTPVFGGSVTFSIPQYGDFFYDMVVRTKISKAVPTTVVAPAIDGGFEDNYWSTLYGSGTDTVDPGDNYTNCVNYCVYPGLRLFKKVAFEVNGNPLDSYDSDVLIMLNKFTVPVNKQTGNDKLLGQETAFTEYAVSYVYATATTTDVPNDVVGRWDTNQTNSQIAPYGGTTFLTTPQQYSNTFNFIPYKYASPVMSGPQTPMPQQPPLEIWSKLRFWFNDDVRLAIPSVSIPFGQRFVNIEICNQNDLIYEYPNLWNTKNTSYGVICTYIYTLNGITANISSMEMYINNIFVNPEIHDIYIRRIGFSLIRVYRKQSSQVNVNSGGILLSQLKWPIEYMYIGFQPKYNLVQPQITPQPYTISSIYRSYYGNWYSWHDWYYMSRQIQVGSQFIGTYSFAPMCTIDTLGVTSHGIPIYADGTSDIFYNSYLPYNYGGINVNTPNPAEDPGCYLVNFALFPRSYQPSGHLNISRARETYVNYTSTYISSTSPCNFICVAVAINFLLITDGSAILRYST